MNKMTEKEIVSFLGQKIDRALNRQGGGVSEQRKKSFDYYAGEKYGDEKEGKSKFVTRECMETVEWGLSQILPSFVSSSKYVEFDPRDQTDENQANQETEAVNYLLNKKRNGFMFFYNWIKDALMNPVSYAGIFMDESKRTEVEHYEGLTDHQITNLLSQYSSHEDFEITSQDSKTEQVQIDGLVHEVEFFDISIKYTKVFKELTPEVIPPEELLIDNDLLSLNIDDADFVCWRRQRSYSELRQSGIDKDILDKVNQDRSYTWNDERVNRLFYEEESPDAQANDTESEKKYWVHQCYAKYDSDGDGISEPHRILMIGSTIVEDEIDSYQPFCALSAIPMPHKHNGFSLIDITYDLQRISSELWRQMLTNIYKNNYPRKYVGENFMDRSYDTMQYLLDPENEYIPSRDPSAINQEQFVDLTPHIMPVAQSIQEMVNVRSGVTEATSLDPNVLQNATLGAVDIANSARSKRVENMIRVFAETGIKSAMIKAHRLLREYQDVPLMIKIQGQWQEVNPAGWRERTDMLVNVGLGTNDKDKEIMIYDKILQLQEKVAPFGLANPKNAYNALEKMVESTGLTNPELFFSNPDLQPPPPPPPPDPQIELAKQQITLAAQEQARRDAETRHRSQLEMFKAQTDREKEIAEFNHRQVMDQNKAQLEAFEAAQKELMNEVERLKKLAETSNIDALANLNRAKVDQTLVETEAQDLENASVHTNIDRLLNAEIAGFEKEVGGEASEA